MNKIALLGLLLTLTFAAASQQTFEWVNYSGGLNNDQGNSIIADANGNVYTTGSFEGVYYVNPGVNNFQLASAGLTDIFVHKISVCNNSGTDVITACDTYTWIDGNTYTASNNTATHVLTNAAGCDSTVTLNLTINNSDDKQAVIRLIKDKHGYKECFKCSTKITNPILP